MNFPIRRVFFSELVFWLLFCGIGLYFLYPLRKSLRFGIDLVGGTYLTLEVEVEKAVDAELITKLKGIDSKLKLARKVPISTKVEKGAIILAFDSMQTAQEAARILKTRESQLEQKVENNILMLQFSKQTAQRIKDDAVQSNIQVLRSRLDRLSVADIPISRQGEKNIIIELPDVSDPQAAKEMIGRAAQLEFKLVDKVGPSEDDILYELDGELPTDKEILPGEGDERSQYYLVQKYTDITGRLLKDARPALGGQTGIEPIVHFEFNEEGSEKFYDITSKNYGRMLAIVLDGEVISAPRINAAIKGSGEISGSFTTDSARTLALLLKSGSFVAPVTFEEERQIGPSLGYESIKQGLTSCLIGLGLLFVFSLFYYNLSGLFAFLALIYNLVLVLFGIAWLKATLTLPGIAGMVLTVGMAIDASILIFERIKEELSQGIAVKKAIQMGFSGAMKVILDANITTFIVGIVLYHFGTGPIQGFAVTMMLGIIATLITTIFFLRSIFKFMLNNFDIKQLKI
ncbi:MAG: protein translocase subunit SecD [Candidatus Babeliales bacterium]